MKKPHKLNTEFIRNELRKAEQKAAPSGPIPGLDVERLHAVIENRVSGRAVGRTEALVQKVCNFVELDDENDIVMQIYSQVSVNTLKRRIRDALTDRGITDIDVKRNLLIVNNKTIFFTVCTYNRIKDMFDFAGRSNFILMDQDARGEQDLMPEIAEPGREILKLVSF